MKVCDPQAPEVQSVLPAAGGPQPPGEERGHAGGPPRQRLQGAGAAHGAAPPAPVRAGAPGPGPREPRSQDQDQDPVSRCFMTSSCSPRLTEDSLGGVESRRSVA